MGISESEVEAGTEGAEEEVDKWVEEGSIGAGKISGGISGAVERESSRAVGACSRDLGDRGNTWARRDSGRNSRLGDKK